MGSLNESFPAPPGAEILAFANISVAGEPSSALNGSHGEGEAFQPRRREAAVVAAVAALLAAVIVAVVLGNLLVVVSIGRERRLRTVANAFIANLALADLLVGVSVMPFALSQFALGGRWIYGRVWCDLWRSLDVLGCTASILNLCAIAMHKYSAVRDPILYPRIASRQRTYLSVALVWLSSAVASFPAIAWWRASDGPMPEQRCDFTADSAYIIMSSLASFYVPSVIMLSVYGRIYCAVNDTARASSAGWAIVGRALGSPAVTLRIHRGSEMNLNATNRSGSSLYRKILALGKEKRAAKTLGIVMGVFLLCWTPFFTCNLVQAFCSRSCSVDPDVWDAVIWLGYANSGVNPVIYALSMRDFRDAFLRTLGRGCASSRGGARCYASGNRSYSRSTSSFSFL